MHARIKYSNNSYTYRSCIMTSSRTIIGAVALTCALVPICWPEIRAENLTYTSVIETAGGKLRGAVFRTIRKHKVYSSFKGIPFAEPPLGYLRFKPPVEKKRWSGVLDALVQGSVCTQYDLFNLTLIGAEDCLYLNVFTPHSDFSNATELKAVMVWIFGGGYLTGYPNTEFTGPDFLLEKDIILVAMNYRLGALGFLNLDHENATGNAGLKDQTLALRWVQRNIREFRGDPDRVTIFGVSAGSSSVDFHILSPMSAGLFSRSIAMSGSAMNTWWPLQSRLESRMQEFAMGFLFGFPSFSKESLLQSLYKADARTIIRRSTLLLFRPSVERVTPVGNQRFLTDCPVDLFASGKYNKGPHMLGTSSLEFLFFIHGIGFDTAIQGDLLIKSAFSPETRDRLYELLGKLLYHLSPLLELISFLAHNVITLLPRLLLRGFLEIFTDLSFRLGIDSKQQLMAQTNDQYPIYYYESSYASGIVKVANEFLNIQGLGHAEDLPMVLYVPMVNVSLEDPEANFMIDRYTTLWTNFAKYGNPTPTEQQEDLGFAWPDSRSTDKIFHINLETKLESRPQGPTTGILEKLGVGTSRWLNFCYV
ncbi:pyrethroid hydrolase Ces2a-like isoform X1 [Trichogramma pretiosum]|uniref:pyrethroid hydrolase Ces2a-like isoform X1 n=1 Tax=Trichogramma pretiosum TaxID=7493 RepID=UPI0006C96332|nr:pyrethroid hydrolase Ces2a-like isoform X1 [Trichogramma pretiosum]